MEECQLETSYLSKVKFVLKTKLFNIAKKKFLSSNMHFLKFLYNTIEFIVISCIVEVQEMGGTLPSTCRVAFKDPDQLHTFQLIITPDDGIWSGGVYKFQIDVPVDYNNVVSIKYYINGWNIS